jgi:adenylosuccinate synthase
MKIDLIFDMQYGSTGKGLLAGYLGEVNKPDMVVNCNMPNAGHTYIDSKGQKMIFKCLPNSIVSPNLTKVLLGPGSVVNLDRLNDEIREAKSFGYLQHTKVWIHPNATILKDEHRDFEASTLNSIASTMQGVDGGDLREDGPESGKLTYRPRQRPNGGLEDERLRQGL